MILSVAHGTFGIRFDHLLAARSLINQRILPMRQITRLIGREGYSVRTHPDRPSGAKLGTGSQKASSQQIVV
jgi:hypothetical protein